jgi:serine phosphatase RsbU (regulator of sigma subunit)
VGVRVPDRDLPRLFAAEPLTEMHRRVLAHDWSTTAAGPIETWSPALLTAAATCLASRVPMLLMLGPELVMLYNDGYSAVLGARHPGALGRTVPEVWPDVWPAIEPLVERTLAGGSTYDEDLALPMTRDGFEEEAWFTFSYSPVRDHTGALVAILDTTVETTRQVLAARRMSLLQRLGTLPRSRSGSANEACASVLEVLARHREDCPFALAYVVGRDGETLRRAAGYGVLPVGELGTEVERWVREAMATGKPVTVHGLAERHPGTSRLPAGPLGDVDVDTAVTLPLLLAGRGSPVGALVVGPSPRLRLDEDHCVFLDLLAGQVTAAVTDARAIKAERERADERSAVQRARVRFFSEVAVTLQRAVLGPTTLPPGFAVHYEPASHSLEVGGDWYDVVDLADGRYGVVVGDVVGRGLASAAVMGQLRSAGRALLLESRSPAQVLSALDTFAERVPGASCSTVFCAIVDPSSGGVRYSSAGHVPAVVADGPATPRLLEGAPGLPLAVDRGRARPEAEIVLPPGATLLLYTDGLVERRAEDLDEGIARVVDVLSRRRDLPPAELVQALTGELLTGERDDDVALLVYRRG